MFEIGTSLREARLRRRLDLVEAEEQTKIRSKYLVALENEDFSVLPGPVFAKGFLRTYATYLGLDGQLYVDEFNSRFSHIQEAEEQVVRAAAPGGGRSVVPPLRVVVVLCLVALAAVTWLGLIRPSSSAPSSGAVVSEVPWVAVGDSVEAISATVSRLAAQGEAAARAAAAQERRQRAAVASGVRLTAVDGEVWVQVRRLRPAGPVVFEGTIARGATRAFQGAKLYVTLGYPANARMTSGTRRLDPVATDAMTYEVTASMIRPVAG